MIDTPMTTATAMPMPMPLIGAPARPGPAASNGSNPTNPAGVAAPAPSEPPSFAQVMRDTRGDETAPPALGTPPTQADARRVSRDASATRDDRRIDDRADDHTRDQADGCAACTEAADEDVDNTEPPIDGTPSAVPNETPQAMPHHDTAVLAAFDSIAAGSSAPAVDPVGVTPPLDSAAISRRAPFFAASAGVKASEAREAAAAELQATTTHAPTVSTLGADGLEASRSGSSGPTATTSPASPLVGAMTTPVADSLLTHTLSHAPAPQTITDALPTAASSMPQHEIDADVRGPAFAPALGAQVAMMARDGLHEARMQLNPAELGPVQVRIALDGHNARVAFHADAFATRAAIEASWPALASALRESGLTLSGGGVFQQFNGDARQAREAFAAARGTQGSDDGESGDPRLSMATRQMRAPRGLVDMVA